MAKSVDPDQKLHSAASDVGLHCLLNLPQYRGWYGVSQLNGHLIKNTKFEFILQERYFFVL